MYATGRPGKPIAAQAVLLDQLLDLRSRLDQLGSAWAGTRVLALKQRVVALIDGIMAARSRISFPSLANEVDQCKEECDRIMGQPETELNAQATILGHHETQIRIEEVERSWRNLNQTVPPFAEEWWNSNFAPAGERFAALRKQFNSTSEADWGEDQTSILSELAALEGLCEVAKARLGDHTAAGRAKSASS